MEKIILIENKQQKKQLIGKSHDVSPGPTWISRTHELGRHGGHRYHKSSQNGTIWI